LLFGKFFILLTAICREGTFKATKNKGVVYMKKTVLILLALSLVMFMTSCGGSGGGSGGGGEGGDDGPGKIFIINSVIPNDAVENLQVVAGKGIRFTAMGMDWFIQDKVVLSDNGNVTDTIKVEIDGITGYNSIYTGKWSQNGLLINVHFTKEKDKIKGKTKDINQHGSADISADGNTLSTHEPQGDLPYTFVFKKQ
jgi:hypothetical protein